MINKFYDLLKPITIGIVICIGIKIIRRKYIAHVYRLNPTRSIKLVRNEEECRLAVEQLRSHCKTFNVLAFDCKFTISGKNRGPVALVQLASYRGLCVLFHLPNFKIFPSSLQDILEDEGIIKIGTNSQQKAIYLFNDFNVRIQSTFHLNQNVMNETVAVMNMPDTHGDFLSVAQMLDRELQWEEEEPFLTQDHIHYAGIYVHIVMGSIKYFGLRWGFIDSSTHRYTAYDMKRYFDLVYTMDLRQLEYVYDAMNYRYKVPVTKQCVICEETAMFHEYFPCRIDLKAYMERDYALRNIIKELYPYMDYSYPAFKDLMKDMRRNNPIILQKTRPVVQMDTIQFKPIDNVSRTVRSNVHVTSNFNECRDLVETLISHCDENAAIGFDCEWVSAGVRGRVALLQLASYRGFCVLIRLCKLGRIPRELKDILADESIVKVGVCPNQDAKYLKEDYNIDVNGTLDLRYMANLAGCQPGGLKQMSQQYLNSIPYKDNWRMHHEWANPQLSQEQIDYAAKDALDGIGLFTFFSKKIENTNNSSDEFRNYLDKNYINSNSSNLPSKKQERKERRKKKRQMAKIANQND